MLRSLSGALNGNKEKNVSGILKFRTADLLFFAVTRPKDVNPLLPN